MGANECTTCSTLKSRQLKIDVEQDKNKNKSHFLLMMNQDQVKFVHKKENIFCFYPVLCTHFFFKAFFGGIWLLFIKFYDIERLYF